MKLEIPDNLSIKEESKIVSDLHAYTMKHTPSKLYRYRNCSEYHINAFKNDELWMSKPSKFNDPHDALLYINREKIINELSRNDPSEYNNLKKQLKEDQIFREGQIQLLGKDFINKILNEKTSDKNLSQKELDFLNSRNTYITDSLIKDSIESVKQASYVACLSENVESTLMWSHYSENHTGFAIEYDFKAMHNVESGTKGIKGSLFINQKIFPVIYSDIRYDATYYVEFHFIDNFYRQMGLKMAYPFYDKLFWYKSMLVKSLDWKYEQEWRIIKLSDNDLNNEKPDFINIPYVKPKAIYFGCDINPINKTELIKIAKSKNIKMFDMILETHEKEFRFNHRGINDA